MAALGGIFPEILLPRRRAHRVRFFGVREGPTYLLREILRVAGTEEETGTMIVQ